MILPTIHLNGTSKQQLLDNYYAAYKSIKESMDKLCEVGFHARDYYVNEDPMAFYKAQDERKEAFDNLNKALEYCEQHVNHLA